MHRRSAFSIRNSAISDYILQNYSVLFSLVKCRGKPFQVSQQLTEDHATDVQKVRENLRVQNLVQEQFRKVQFFANIASRRRDVH